MGKESRVIHLQKELIDLGNSETLRALNLMIGIMNANDADNGYSRHDGSHYYYHLVDGCQDLINHGITDQNTLTGYVLHDSVEDIKGFTVDRVANEFGYEVALIVNGVTKKEGIDYKVKENMQAYLNYILHFSKMCLVKTADRKHNFATLGDATPEKELRVAKETQELFLPFFKQSRNLYPEYSSYFHSAKTTIVPHLKRIVKSHDELEKKNKRIEELEFKLNLLIERKR